MMIMMSAHKKEGIKRKKLERDEKNINQEQ
jgi:hypothetical protein